MYYAFVLSVIAIAAVFYVAMGLFFMRGESPRWLEISAWIVAVTLWVTMMSPAFVLEATIGGKVALVLVATFWFAITGYVAWKLSFGTGEKTSG